MEEQKLDVVENALDSMIKTAEKNGMKFTDRTEAVAWATKHLTKQYEKIRKYGIPIKCLKCGLSYSNKETGPLLRKEGGYIHQGCLNV